MVNSNTEILFELIKAGLWGDVKVNGYRLKVKESAIDWGEVYRLAEEQSVIGLVAAGIEMVQGEWLKVHGSPLVPQEWALQFIGQTLQLEQRNKAMNAFVASLFDKLKCAGIYALLVKGQGIAQCYDKPLWRACGDVDLFLNDDNYEMAKEFLMPLASSVEKEYEREKHLGMTIDGWVVELHGRLYCGLSSGIERELDDVYKDTFCKGKVRSWMNDKVQVFQLAVENDVFYVFTHILQHFYKGGIGLRQICDWCRLLYTYRESLNYEHLEQRINQAGLMSEWRAFYNLASRYLGMPDYGSWLMVKDSRFDKKADRIMEFILKSGNMGHNRGSWLTVHDSWFSRQYVVRKSFSMFRRIGDLINHSRIFPLDSLRFSFTILKNGVMSAVRGEG